ncbi:interleukin-13 receptor subunit alpha-1-like [Heptranchias perlo]|uniref:interleukin-13 receptor subunit alpha-1-like n=1 Tax=Heptranchias perlo TaxID=212740 RepID=UPI003559C89A
MRGSVWRLIVLSVPCLLAVPLGAVKDRCTWSAILPSPTHLNVTLKGIGFINYTWAWKPPSDLENSTSFPVRYKSSLKYEGDEWEGTKINPFLTRTEVVTLNTGITFRVKALVEPEGYDCQESNWTEIYIPPEEGDAETSVRNFSCVYYNFEYINCTWDFGHKAPSDTVYDFHYWQDGLEVIQNCTSYILKDGRTAGCHLHGDKFDDKLDLNTCVTGVSAGATIKPFFYNLESKSFVKLSPPWGINILKTDNAFDINWEVPAYWNQKCVNYQLRMRSGASSPWKLHSYTNPTAKIIDANTRVRNIVQVQAKHSFCGDNGVWSEWSTEKYFGEDMGQSWNWKVVLLIIIPILVAAAAIVLLTYLKQLQILILPPIPDPGKLFKGMFGDSNGDYSTWNKQPKGSLTFKAEEEIICKVTTVEQLTCPSERGGKLGENEGLEEDAFIVCVDEEISVDDDHVRYDLVTS